LLKENFKIINEEKEFKLVQNHIDSLEQQKPFQVFNNHVVCYLEDFCSQYSQPLINCGPGNGDDEELVLKPTLFSCP